MRGLSQSFSENTAAAASPSSAAEIPQIFFSAGWKAARARATKLPTLLPRNPELRSAELLRSAGEPLEYGRRTLTSGNNLPCLPLLSGIQCLLCVATIRSRVSPDVPSGEKRHTTTLRLSSPIRRVTESFFHAREKPSTRAIPSSIRRTDDNNDRSSTISFARSRRSSRGFGGRVSSYNRCCRSRTSSGKSFTGITTIA